MRRRAAPHRGRHAAGHQPQPGSARRVRKFGRGRFAGESCRGPGRRDWRIGWPPSRWRRPVHPSPSGLERKTRPAERRRSRRPEHRLDRELHQRREGRANLAVTGHPDGTEESWLTLAPARVALLCPPPCKVAAEIPEATGSGFPWKSVTTEFTNPTGRASRPAIRAGSTLASGELEENLECEGEGTAAVDEVARLAEIGL